MAPMEPREPAERVEAVPAPVRTTRVDLAGGAREPHRRSVAERGSQDDADHGPAGRGAALPALHGSRLGHRRRRLGVRRTAASPGPPRRRDPARTTRARLRGRAWPRPSVGARAAGRGATRTPPRSRTPSRGRSAAAIRATPRRCPGRRPRPSGTGPWTIVPEAPGSPLARRFLFRRCAHAAKPPASGRGLRTRRASSRSPPPSGRGRARGGGAVRRAIGAPDRSPVRLVLEGDADAASTAARRLDEPLEVGLRARDRRAPAPSPSPPRSGSGSAPRERRRRSSSRARPGGRPRGEPRRHPARGVGRLVPGCDADRRIEMEAGERVVPVLDLGSTDRNRARRGAPDDLASRGTLRLDRSHGGSGEPSSVAEGAILRRLTTGGRIGGRHLMHCALPEARAPTPEPSGG